MKMLLHPQLPQPGPPLVLVARPWNGTTVVTVVVGAGGGSAPQGSPQLSQNTRLSIPSHLSTRHTWEQTGCTSHSPVPRPCLKLGTDQELLMRWKTIASNHVPHQWC